MKELLTAAAIVAVLFCIGAIFLFPCSAHAADPKFCGIVVHDLSTGKLHRDASAVAEYLEEWPKPVPTIDWQVDHIIPLDCGGCDTPANMALMHKSIKTCKAPILSTDPYCKDRYERRKDVFCGKPVTHIYVP